MRAFLQSLARTTAEREGEGESGAGGGAMGTPHIDTSVSNYKRPVVPHGPLWQCVVVHLQPKLQYKLLAPPKSMQHFSQLPLPSTAPSTALLVCLALCCL